MKTDPPMFDRRDDPNHLLHSLKSFLNVWHGDLPHWYGIAPEKLAETPLPEPLRRLYSFAGHWPADNFYCSAFANQDYLLPFELLFRSEGRLLFAGENQGCWQCCTELEGEDPPVWVRYDHETWEPLCDSLARFLVTLCLHETVFGARYKGYGENVTKRFKELGRHVVPLWLQGPYPSAYLRSTEGHSFYAVNARVLILDDRWCATNDEALAKSLPDLFKPPPTPPDPATSKPIWEMSDVPLMIRQNILNGKARQHQEQADFHALRAAMFREMAVGLEKRDG